jgi:outer membrane receptor protein involved in Fe transport
MVRGWHRAEVLTALWLATAVGTAHALPVPSDAVPAPEAPAEAAPAPPAPPAQVPATTPGAPDTDAAPPKAPTPDASEGQPGAPEATAEGTAPPEPTALEPGADRETGIRGRIAGGPSGEPLEAAPVMIEGGGKTRTALTDARGAYEAYAPPGRYTVRSYYDLFYGARLDGVRVRRGAFTEANLVLDAIDEEQEVVVEEVEIAYRADTTTAAAQDQLRQASVGIGEGMGAEQMSRAGAGDAESAAKRVVGVTIDSKQLVIRGLGGRYTRVLLNGDPIPSTDPDRPGVDLDLFPTSVIDSFTVQKVFLPEMPGDFAGGILEINTVSYPRDFTLELGASTGASTESTFRKRLDYDGGSHDFLGFDDGRREIPDSVPDDEELRVTRASSPGSFKSSDQIEPIAEDFRNVWEFDRTRAWPKVGLDATVGDSFDLPDAARLGYMVATVYDHKDLRERGPQNRTGPMAFSSDYEKGGEQVLLSAFATGGLDLGIDHSLTLLSMANRSMEDEAKYKSGSRVSTGRFEEWQLSFVTRTLWFNQLRGDHRNLADERLRLRWSGYYALADRDEPDRRGIEYGERGGIYRWDDKAGSGERYFSKLEQTDGGGRTNLRFPLWSEAWGTIGGGAHLSSRGLANRRFLMEPLLASDQTVFGAPAEELFSEEGIGTLTRIREQTNPLDSYDSKQLLFAGFVQLETPIVRPLSAAGGVRIESFHQNLLARSPFEDPADVMRDDTNSIDRTDTDILPGGALKYGLTDDMFLRSGYGMTLGRAQIRELAPYPYYDFGLERTISGNPALTPTTIHNVDLRWEWFFDEAQIVAVTGFYKQFVEPIELQRQNATNSQFLNAESATSLGVEAEFRVNLGRLARALARFDLDTNLTLVHSRVELPQGAFGVIGTERRMFGQAPYVLNVAFYFFDPPTKLRCGLVYNVVGPKIVETGMRAGDTVWQDKEEQAFHSLDFVSSWGFAEHFKLKLKLKNLLFASKHADENAFYEKTTYSGMEGSLGLAYEH